MSIPDGPPPSLRALLAAECAAEAGPADADDLQQAVRLRWLERVQRDGRPPRNPAVWLRRAVRAEARGARRRARREVPYGEAALPFPGPRPVISADGTGDRAYEAEAPLLAEECRRAVAAAVGRLPGRCPAVLDRLLNGRDLTYEEIARELGMSQGTVGPLRARCLECLRRQLRTEVAAAGARGMVR